MTLETERLLLRPWEEGDAEALYKYAKDPLVGPAAGWSPHKSVEDSRNIIRTVLSEPETYAVILKETGEPVGSSGIMPPRSDHPDAAPEDREIGYWIGVPYWGRGLIPEAAEELLRRCFEDLGCPAVWCACNVGNDKSRRVMEKCGFATHHVECGRTDLLGEVHDEEFTRITKEVWLARH